MTNLEVSSAPVRISFDQKALLEIQNQSSGSLNIEIVTQQNLPATALGKLAEVDTNDYTTSSFTDVELGRLSQAYIEWACEKGIIHGIGNNDFAHDRAITREEIAVSIANFAKATGYTSSDSSDAITYADYSSIGKYYEEAVTSGFIKY